MHLSFQAYNSAATRSTYYHYLWGYLLPAAYLAWQHEAAYRSAPTPLYMESCGPALDTQTRSFFDMLGLDVTIMDRDALFALAIARVRVPRWDQTLGQLTAWARHGIILRHTWPGPTYPALGRAIRPRTADATDMWTALYRKTTNALVSFADIGRFHAATALLRAHVLGHLPPPSAAVASLAGRWLLLRRSDHANTGKATGRERRHLRGTAAALARLTDAGLDIAECAPGQLSLMDQIHLFGRARGVVCVRGAELANVFWMRPGTHVVTVNALPGVTPAYGLAIQRRIHFHQLPADHPIHPTLDADAVLHSLRLSLS